MAKKDKLNDVEKEITDEQEGIIATSEVSKEVIEETPQTATAKNLHQTIIKMAFNLLIT